MEGIILFSVDLDYELTAYKPLAASAIKCTYNPNKKKYEWVFNLADLDFVVASLATPITFIESEKEIEALIELCPPILKRIPASRWKGTGEYSFIEKPTIFLCGEWQKDSKGVPKQQFTKIPKQNVIDVWDILLRYPKGKVIRGRTIAEHLCREKGYDRFYDSDRNVYTKVFRSSGSFDFKKFWGLHRKGYMPFCYWPFKVLDHLGAAKFDKSGRIQRLGDNLEFQSQFKLKDFVKTEKHRDVQVK